VSLDCVGNGCASFFAPYEFDYCSSNSDCASDRSCTSAPEIPPFIGEFLWIPNGQAVRDHVFFDTTTAPAYTGTDAALVSGFYADLVLTWNALATKNGGEAITADRFVTIPPSEGTLLQTASAQYGQTPSTAKRLDFWVLPPPGGNCKDEESIHWVNGGYTYAVGCSDPWEIRNLLDNQIMDSSSSMDGSIKLRSTGKRLLQKFAYEPQMSYCYGDSCPQQPSETQDMDKCADGSWVEQGNCPDTCDNMDSMTIEFMNFIQKITHQTPTVIRAHEHHGFCSTDIQKLAETDSDTFKNWAEATVDTSNPTLIVIHGLEPFQATAGESTDGGNNGGGATAPPAVTAVSLTMTLKLASVSDAQKADLISDIADSLQIDASRISVKVGASASGSTVITVTITASDDETDLSPKDAAALLATQLSDPQSDLRTSTIGKSLDPKKGVSVKVTHADDPADDASSAVTASVSIVAAVLVAALL